jgi:hypothetical protein
MNELLLLLLFLLLLLWVSVVVAVRRFLPVDCGLWSKVSLDTPGGRRQSG